MTTRVAELPERLRWRTRVVGGESAPPSGGEFVLYWARTAIRAYENQALDVAVWLANRAGLPVLVYHAVSERYPYANDRHHTFILEGARDFAAQLATRGIPTAFHCERPGHRGPHLLTLAERAHAVITEDMPVAPLREWTESLSRRASCPLWSVDSACVIPRGLIKERVTRAFVFRKKVARHLPNALLPWEDVEPEAESFSPSLPFTPVDWDSTTIAELVSACEIDHTVGPVAHTRGGSEAGYARWDDFRDHGLHGYAARRNDPLRKGVSRMSAYLHYGMVSPMRLAREASARDGKGPEKYLDELIIWRELAYNFCTFTPNLDSLEALPDWARDTLEIHRSDPRPVVHDLETLARAQSGDALWDIAQRSLLVHGELHNNVRMTWGKTILGWTANPEQALAYLVDLNHRFALDGRDPASYGGILWCLGQFDRPFEPERPIFGRIRPRDTAFHAKRLSPAEWGAQIKSTSTGQARRIAVIGAGPAGAFAARTLADHGHEITVFDKSRGVGGRMSNRRRESLSFDHGAQYFTIRDARMKRWLDAWLAQGVVRHWDGRFVRIDAERAETPLPQESRYVAVPAMTGLCKHLLKGLNVHLGERVHSVIAHKESVELQLHHGAIHSFDDVLLTAPAPQSVEMLREHGALTSELEGVHYAPCWAVMIESPGTMVEFDAARVDSSPLAWVAREESKPERGQAERWTLHSTPDWALAHWDASPEEVGHALTGAFADLIHAPEPAPVVSAHRWRYALVTSPLSATHLQAGRVFVAGDAFGAGRVESALLSGASAAGALLGRVHGGQPQSHQLPLLS